jgi:RNA polymerase sigma-70 factor (sigma-E family)
VDAAAEQRFRAFVAECTPALLRRAYLLTGGDHDAAGDLVQAALAKTATHWHRVDNPAAYARAAMYRQQVSWWRLGWHRYEQSGGADALPERVTADPVAATDVKLVVRAALRRLTPRQRAVLFLRYYEDLPEAEVAGILECSIGTVRSTGYRALARLREVAPELADLHYGVRPPAGFSMGEV